MINFSYVVGYFKNWHKESQIKPQAVSFALQSGADPTYPKCWHYSFSQFFQQHLLPHKCNDHYLEPEHLRSENKIMLWNHSFYFVSNWGFSINVICDLWFFICVLKVFKHIKNRGNSKMDGYMPITHIQHLSRFSNSFMSYLIWISSILLVEGLERPFKYDSDKITKKSQLIYECVIQGFKYTIFPCPGPCSVK